VRREGAETWRYGVARISTAELALLLDGAQVWSVPHLETPKTQTSYAYFSLPITAVDPD
jgi:hypothetical protein